MIPSLVAEELRQTIVEYLATTFSIGDDATARALETFLTDPDEGIFRGPYVRVRLPFRTAAEDWQLPLSHDFAFQPYQHQATAFERLTSLNHEPLPTLVTTGTGSGKTESFLLPILDHCLRHKGEPGIKALILYPMNALAFDQAGRIAEAVASDSALAGIRAGLFVGDADGVRRTSMASDGLIEDHAALRDEPPDILLTNYKMLDLLLIRGDDRKLWRNNNPDTLRYVVLDEFHTYDGAQGTDVSMLLRRLGARLGMATDERPLGSATPVATSATLGSGADVSVAMRTFAEKVFGRQFPEDSIITETRMTPEEACGKIEYSLPIPPADQVAEQGHDSGVLGELFLGESIADPVELGEGVRQHPLTHAVLDVAGQRFVSWERLRELLFQRAPDWGRNAISDPAGTDAAIGSFLALLSQTRQQSGERLTPRFLIEIQLWVREVSRLQQDVAAEPQFAWTDALASEELGEGPERVSLPAAYCRECGRTGWYARQSESGSMDYDANQIYRAMAQHSRQLRALIRADSDDESAHHLHIADRTVRIDPDPDGNSIAVLHSPDENDARQQRCPSCRAADAMRPIGSRIATLASVAIGQLFGSTTVEDDQRKLLVFTDSVQDASHRSSFFMGRTFRFNLRTALASAIVEAGGLPLSAIGKRLLDVADPEARAERRFGVAPPEVARDPALHRMWSADFDGDERDLEQRLALEAALEFGLRSRVGRTLELAGVSAGVVESPELADVAALIAEAHAELGRQLSLDREPDYEGYILGLLERMRRRGAIQHRWLKKYIENDNRWHIWGGRFPEPWMPAFPTGTSAPAFPIFRSSDNFDPIGKLSTTPTWWIDWTNRLIGEGPHNGELAKSAFRAMAKSGLILAPTKSTFALDPGRIVLTDITNESQHAECGTCGDRVVGPEAVVTRWLGRPCLRYRCMGRYERQPVDDGSFYKALYSSGILRRVVAAEHTGLLQRADREALETAFKTGRKVTDPNVIAATPTLELGIDIGDLSVVMLAGVPPKPANYIQRVGRAGRQTGNALVVALAGRRPRELYYLEQPLEMIEGDIRAPDAYLEAIGILNRQFAAFGLDRIADGTIEFDDIPRQASQVFGRPDGQPSWIERLAVQIELHPTFVDSFLFTFPGLNAKIAAKFRETAMSSFAHAAKTAQQTWSDRLAELEQRRNRLKSRIEELEGLSHLSNPQKQDLGMLRGERKSVVGRMQDLRGEYGPGALQRFGLLPNYTLFDDGAELSANLWRRTGTGSDDFESTNLSYQRAGRLALREFAPGNTFYAGGQKLRVDSLQIGGPQQPGYEEWRLCPECGFGLAEDEWTFGSCSRCNHDGLADQGARHTLLRFTGAQATNSMQAAQVLDESDDRDQAFFEMVTIVDADPAFASSAYQHKHEAFGIELLRDAAIRTYNFGPQGSAETTRVGGVQVRPTKFRTCRLCGVVDGALPRRDGEPVRHVGWCRTRSGMKEAWDEVVLYHELRTEAVRMLLPVSTVNVQERLTSFKAALLLGLREDFGGDPDHIGVELSQIPAAEGGYRRFLVLYDTIPGGTGYLRRLVDPAGLKRVLEKARDAMQTCECVNSGEPACYRCLLGVINDRESRDVSRRLANELVDQLLEKWELEPAIGGTISDLPIQRVEESELELRFRQAIWKWAEKGPKVTVRDIAASNPYQSFQLTFEEKAGTHSWRVDQERKLTDTSIVTQPDFLFTPTSGSGQQVAVYLDGYAYHAQPPKGLRTVADDARKRESVRDSGRLVWSLTWEDVNAFADAVEAGRALSAAPFWSADAKATAQHYPNAGLNAGVADHNPMDLLLRYLAGPERSAWTGLAASWVFAAIQLGSKGAIESNHAPEWLAEAGASGHSTGSGEGPIKTRQVHFNDGLRLTVAVDTTAPSKNAMWWTAVLSLRDDRSVGKDEANHRRRWQRWLRWGNVLQFLTGPRRDAIITSHAHAKTIDWANYDLVTGVAEADAELEFEDADLVDPGALDLVLSLVEKLGELPEIGFELESGLVIEAAFHGAKVAVVVGVDEERDSGLEADGWTVHAAGTDDGGEE